MSPVRKPEMTEANLAAQRKGFRARGKIRCQVPGVRDGTRDSGLGINCRLSAVSCQLQEDSSLRPTVAARECGHQVRNRGNLAPRDVKNEDRSDYVYENKGEQ